MFLEREKERRKSMKKIISLILVSLVGIAVTFASDHSATYTTRAGFGKELVAKLVEQYGSVEYETNAKYEISKNPELGQDKEFLSSLSEERGKYQTQAEEEGKLLIVRGKSFSKEVENNNPDPTYIGTPTDDITICRINDEVMLQIVTDSEQDIEIRNFPKMSDSEYYKLVREIKAEKIKKISTNAKKQQAATTATTTAINIGATILWLLF
jgi:L-cysteine desulfidase